MAHDPVGRAMYPILRISCSRCADDLDKLAAIAHCRKPVWV